MEPTKCKASPQSIIATESRRIDIRNNLKRGDIARIAQRMGVTRVWVSFVLNGRGVSEPVLTMAETLINERNQNQ